MFDDYNKASKWLFLIKDRVTVNPDPNLDFEFKGNFSTSNQILNKGKNKERKFEFLIPNKEALPILDKTENFILVTQNFSFGNYTTVDGKGSGFAITLEFILWDYDKNDVISFGGISSSVPSNFYVSKSDWLKLMRCSATRKN